jgi:integrase
MEITIKDIFIILISVASLALSAFTLLLVETGLRVGEVCQLRRGDLDAHARR